jgi:DHA1 family bicyclomycin/chloramphenicol resistance-like MFS transporter
MTPIGRYRSYEEDLSFLFHSALDTYMPAMPQMGISLHTTAAVIQLTVTGYIIGMAVGQLIAGPISDGIGRRPLLLTPAIVFIVASVICATAVNPYVLVVTRLFHGIAAGATVACGRAVVGDRYRGADLATRFGTLTAATQIGPVIAPGLGSAILAVGDWRAIFWGMAVLGVVMVGWIALGVPETLPPEQRHGAGVGPTVKRMSDLISNREFSWQVVITCLVMFGFYIYIGGSSFVLQTVYGISESEFALVFAVNSGLIMVGSIAYRLLVSRCGPRTLRNAGVLIALTAVLVLVAAARTAHPPAPPLSVTWVLLGMVTGSMGLVIPASMTMAQQAGDRARGTAASLQGGLTQAACAIATPMTGIFGDTGLLPMAVLMAAGFAAGAAAMVTAARLRSRWQSNGRWPESEPEFLGEGEGGVYEGEAGTLTARGAEPMSEGGQSRFLDTEWRSETPTARAPVRQRHVRRADSAGSADPCERNQRGLPALHHGHESADGHRNRSATSPRRGVSGVPGKREGTGP